MTGSRRSLALAQAAARRSLEAADAAADAIKQKPDSRRGVSWLYFQSVAAQAMTGDARGAIRTIGKEEEDPLFRCQALSLIVELLSATEDEWCLPLASSTK